MGHSASKARWSGDVELAHCGCSRRSAKPLRGCRWGSLEALSSPELTAGQEGSISASIMIKERSDRESASAFYTPLRLLEGRERWLINLPQLCKPAVQKKWGAERELSFHHWESSSMRSNLLPGQGYAGAPTIVPPPLAPSLPLMSPESVPLGEAAGIPVLDPRSVPHLKRDILQRKKPTCYA